jgi:hypothetical protein
MSGGKMRFRNLLVLAICAFSMASYVSAEEVESFSPEIDNPNFGIGFNPGVRVDLGPTRGNRPQGGGRWGGGHHGGWNGGGGSVVVLGAFYGANCGAGFRGNATWHVQQACNGQQTCWYQVNHGVLGDPACGCHKDFRVNYTCGDGQTRQAYLMGEASGQMLTLSCH